VTRDDDYNNDDDDDDDYNVIIISLKVEPTCKTLYHTLDVFGHWTLSVKNQTLPKIFTVVCSNNKPHSMKAKELPHDVF
jgi:hypothetical protein